MFFVCFVSVLIQFYFRCNQCISRRKTRDCGVWSGDLILCVVV